MTRLASALAILALLCGINIGLGQEKLSLPADPALWINSPPVSLESLQGKGIVLYFFEEECPSCASKWPELSAMARQFSDKPVVFIGISSGTQRGDIETYMRSKGVSWPVVLDPAREIEKAAGVGAISLQNIYQYRYITADGKMHQGDWKDVPGTAEKALVGEAWRVDPKGLPAALKPAWQNVELGNFAAASGAIKKAIEDKKPDVKAAGEKLQTAVQESLAKEIAALPQDTSEKWATYKAFRGIADRYKGFDLPADFKQTGSALHKDEGVQKQLDALAELEAMKKSLTSGSPVVRRKALDKLDKLIADHPGTDAAEMAEAFKQRAGM